MDLTTIFNSFAFPVAVVMALMYYIVTKDKAQRESMERKDKQIAELTETHSQESSQFTSALNRNTVVLERLCTLLGDRGTLDVPSQE